MKAFMRKQCIENKETFMAKEETPMSADEIDFFQNSLWLRKLVTFEQNYR
jgi:hypothetical protein